jgi:hypothetical protein
VVLGDVVAELGTDGSGSLELESDRVVLASSRTYNLGDDGTFGLFLDGVPTGNTANRGDTVWLPQLRQNRAFRTNFGLVNSSDEQARVRFFFYDSSGNELFARTRTLEAEAWVQYQEPISRLAGRTDIDSASAKVEVTSGGGVIAYASVIDNATNDGTAIAMKR